MKNRVFEQYYQKTGSGRIIERLKLSDTGLDV